MLVDMVSLMTNTSKLTLKHTDSKTNQRICIYGHQILSTLRNTGNFKDASLIELKLNIFIFLFLVPGVLIIRLM